MKQTRWIRFKHALFGSECAQYGIQLWQCPGMLFLGLGLVTIASTFITFFVGRQHSGPEVVIPLLFGVVVAIFVPGSLLVRSFERLALADRMKSEFVRVTSHQLRSPMAAIKWLVDLLITNRIGSLEKEQHNYVQLIQQNNDHMIELVNNLLDVVRIEQKNLSLKREPVNLAKLVHTIFDANKINAEAKKITLSLEEPRDPVTVLGDEVHLSAAVTNFIDNAIKYSNEGGLVTVRIYSNDGLVRCEIEDHGIGIPKHEKQFIFSKFFIGNNPLNYRTGLGLGLFIARATLRAMGGRVGFTSQEGKGSTFWFTMQSA